MIRDGMDLYSGACLLAAAIALGLATGSPADLPVDPPVDSDYSGANVRFSFLKELAWLEMPESDYNRIKDTVDVPYVSITENHSIECASSGGWGSGIPVVMFDHMHFRDEYGDSRSQYPGYDAMPVPRKRWFYDNYMYGPETAVWVEDNAKTAGNCYTYAFDGFGPHIRIKQSLGSASAKVALEAVMSESPYNYDIRYGDDAISYCEAAPYGAPYSCTEESSHAWRMAELCAVASWREGQGSCVISYWHSDTAHNCAMLAHYPPYEWEAGTHRRPSILWAVAGQ